jgi:hypothetical protein
VIARTHDGKEIYKNSKIYMPHPARFGVVDRMGRGPYEKSGMIRDTSLPPQRTVHESFEIPFPFEDIKKKEAVLRKLIAEEMEVEVRLLYLPFGERNQNHYVWFITKRMVRLN